MTKTIKTLTLVILTILLQNKISAQNLNLQWAKQAGVFNQNDRGNSITIDSLGNVYTAGYFQDTVDFDPGIGVFNLASSGVFDIFIQKLDPNGNFLWAKQIGGVSHDQIYSISVDAFGNLYSIGSFNDSVDFDPGTGVTNLTSNGYSDIFILKLTSNGDFLWVKQIGGTGSDSPSSITTDSAGNVYSIGQFYDVVDIDPGVNVMNFVSAGASDIFIQKLDPNGNFLWAKYMGGTSFDAINSIYVDDLANCYTTGYFRNTVDFNPGMGTYNLSAVGINDKFIQKLDANGDFQWTKQIGGASTSCYPRNIVLDKAGNIFTSGYFYGTVDFNPGTGTNNLTAIAGTTDMFVEKFNPNGDFLWVKQFGGTSYDYSNTMDIDTSGNIYTSGYFQGTADFFSGSLTSFGSADIFILKLNTDGDSLWVHQIGGTSTDIVQSIKVDSKENIYVTGFFRDSVDFDPNASISNLITANYDDIFTLKLNQCTPNSGIATITACNSYTWIDGITYTTSNNTATDTLMNTSGCDSIVTLNLTINNSTSGVDMQTACDSYTWIDGITYTTSNNTATDTLMNTSGCDSIVTLNLTINNSTSGIDSQIACDSFTWIDGITYTSSNNTATDTLTNAVGCDSVVTLNLTINNVSDLTAINNGLTIQANNSGATYVWLDCDNNYSQLSGETNQSYLATVNGNYAVELTENGCTDTSICTTISSVGIVENELFSRISIFPNPTSGKFQVTFEESNLEIQNILVFNTLSQLIPTTPKMVNPNSVELDLSAEKPGVYYLKISQGDKWIMKRVVMK